MTLPTREEISPDGRMMRQCIQTDATHYETANYRRVAGPWGQGWRWELVGSRVRHDGVALPWVEHAAPAPVPVESAEVARETVDTYGVRRIEEAHQTLRRQAEDDYSRRHDL